MEAERLLNGVRIRLDEAYLQQAAELLIFRGADPEDLMRIAANTAADNIRRMGYRVEIEGKAIGNKILPYAFSIDPHPDQNGELYIAENFIRDAGLAYPISEKLRD